jgi:hypothetical protein
VAEFANACETVLIVFPCRDPRDDKFLEVAVHGRADVIVTGDRDLLDLNPFRGIEILTPAEYLKRGRLNAARYPEDKMNPSANQEIPGDKSSSPSRKPVRRVAVYCGSADGNNPAFLAEAQALGAAIAAAGLGLVYGGANVGLMGAVADAALAGGAEVIGVLPAVLAGREIAHNGLTALEFVPTMHERKARMSELADAFLVLPGGYGTLEELLEAVTWAQLGLHAKPCILINTAGYWDGLLAFLDSAVAAGFLRQKNRELMRVAADAKEAVKVAAKDY